MATFNGTIAVGRLVNDPNFYCDNSKKTAEFKINNNGDLYNIIAYGKQASVCKSYLRKGNLCCVEGRVDRDKDAIIADRVTFLSNVYRQY